MEESENCPQSYGKKTFAEILASSSLGKSLDSSIAPTSEKAKIGLLKGKPSVSFNKQHVLDLAAPFKRSLVGKFSQGRPKLEDIHSYMVSLDLRGQFQIGLLDSRHVILNLQCDEDYHRIYSRMVWYVGDSVMRIFKWTTNFHVDKESPIVPVWIELEKLPIFLFQRDALFTIASTVGLPLRLDSATVELRKPSVARILVEINLLKDRPDSIWIGLGEEDGFWQKIKYCNVPDYCPFCWHVGHAQDQCHVKNPTLRQTQTEHTNMVKEHNNVTRGQVYRVKEKKDDPRMEFPDAGNGNKSITQDPGDTTAGDVRVSLINNQEDTELNGCAAQRTSLIDSSANNCASTSKATTPLSEEHTTNMDEALKNAAKSKLISTKEDHTIPLPAIQVVTHDAQTMEAIIPSDPSQQIDPLQQANLVIDLSPYPLLTNSDCAPLDITNQNSFAVLSRMENLSPASVAEIVGQVYLEAASSNHHNPPEDELCKKDRLVNSDAEVVLQQQQMISKEGNLSPRTIPPINKSVPARVQPKRSTASKNSTNSSK